MYLVDPDVYLNENPLDESLIVSLTADSESRSLTLVITYAITALSILRSSRNWDRDFRYLKFTAVTALERHSSLYKQGLFGFDRNDLNVHLESFPPQVVQWARADVSGFDYRVTMHCGSLGTYEFKCGELFVARRLGRAARNDDSPERYTDVESGEPFNFYHPFEP